MSYQVKEVANMVGVSVRTLHHYDHIGLLQPEYISPAGYRQYTDENLERLQQILFFKEVGFGLKEIQKILDDPKFDRKKALMEHKGVLEKKKQRLQKMIATVEKTIDSIQGGIKMKGHDLFGGFSMKDIEEHQEKYAKEAEEKYGEVYRKTQKKTANYSKEDWQNIMSEADTIYKRLAALSDRSSTDEKVQSAINDWREHISTHYYECTVEIFRGLGDMYVADERFTKNIDKYGEGLAAFMKEAIQEYCNRRS
jgi:MerR family transcriptional regulator, multidrug-efflux activator